MGNGGAEPGRVVAPRTRASRISPCAGGHAQGSTPQPSSRILVPLSMAFGVPVGVLAVMDPCAVGIVAAIGAMVPGTGRSVSLTL